MIDRTDAGPLMPEQVSLSISRAASCPIDKPFAVVDKKGRVLRCHPTKDAARQHIASAGMDAAIRRKAGR